MPLDMQRREQLIEALVQRAAQMGVTAPALLFLETYKPLTFLGAQMLWAAQPFLSIWLKDATVRDLALLLEDRDSVEQLIARLESPSSELHLANRHRHLANHHG